MDLWGYEVENFGVKAIVYVILLISFWYLLPNSPYGWDKLLTLPIKIILTIVLIPLVEFVFNYFANK